VSRVLYFDCFSGISGDMAIGAMIDAGLPLEELKHALGSLALGSVHVHAERVLRAGISATKFTVHEHPAGSTEHPGESTHHPGGSTHHHRAGHRSLREIFHLIDGSNLSEAGRARAKSMFQRLGEAEAAIHQMPIDRVHLHEVGALDSIVDIVGIVFAMAWAGIDRIVSSPLNVGSGTVRSAHGVFPVPAPATVRLLGDAPVYGGDLQHELVTPTGALIVSTYATSFGPIPSMSVEHVGYGAGAWDHPERPNVLRVLIGGEAAGSGSERVTVVECEIDDMNPQIFGVLMDKLYGAGALEVFYVPVQMKKNRPGTLLTVIAPVPRRPAVVDLIFRETTTIGLRHHDVDRDCLQREIVSVATPVGSVRFKIARRDGRVMNAVPEFDDCAKLAASNNLSIKEVQAMAIQAYGASRS
jgi:uncharacterized protein (TIGR00299 family) protein